MVDAISSAEVENQRVSPTASVHEGNLTQQSFSAADLLVAYLRALDIEYVYGIPGGSIEPLYDALLRSEREGSGPIPIVARHESGAAFMADGYARNSGKVGVCCATTGPGATNLITGVSSAYENNIPLLVITAQTASEGFGRKASQESTDTGVNTVGMFQYCTGYNSLVSHVAQLERKLVSALIMAVTNSCPVHLSVPLDVFRGQLSKREPAYDIAALLQVPRLHDDAAIAELCRQLEQARQVVFVLGSGCQEAVPLIITVAFALGAKIVTTPDGKGLVSPYHPLFFGVIGFAGHQCAENTLCDSSVDTVVAVGTTLSEWQSNGWDEHTILNGRLIHIESLTANLTRSPMARLQVRGSVVSIFETVAKKLDVLGKGLDAPAIARDFKEGFSEAAQSPCGLFDGELPDRVGSDDAKVKPQWLMSQLTRLFPPHTKYLADTGNSLAWAIHFLHPYDRRLMERRHSTRTADGSVHLDNGRRIHRAGLFQVAVEFASMGWAIGASVGAAMACPRQPVVCITGDGSLLMSGQEITVAAEHQLPIVFVILNDSSLGMVKHGQRLTGAEVGANALPVVDFSQLAAAMGVRSERITCSEDFLGLDLEKIFYDKGPFLLDVLVDPDEVPPIGVRTKALRECSIESESLSDGKQSIKTL